MKKLLAFIGIAAVVVLAIVGALSTPTAYTANPYVVGGELEVPKTSSTSSTNIFIVALVAIVAVAIGAFVAYRYAK